MMGGLCGACIQFSCFAKKCAAIMQRQQAYT